MKTIALLLMISTAFSGLLSAQEKDMRAYMNETRELQKQGKNAEALERHIWFHNHALQYNKAMVGVRLSFALNDWKKLGDVYPPALSALKEIRNNKTQQVAAGGSKELFQDVSGINRTLDQEDETFKLFEGLMKTHPDIAKRDWLFVKDAMFKAKRYDILQLYIGNPLREFSVVVENYNRMTGSYDKVKNACANLKAYNENNFVEKSLQLIDFAIANKDVISAKEIKKEALNVVQDYRLEKVNI